MTRSRIRVVVCEVCARRRRCTVAYRHTRYFWRCSQGHTWQEIAGPLEQIDEVMRQELVPCLSEMFTDTAFCRHLRRG